MITYGAFCCLPELAITMAVNKTRTIPIQRILAFFIEQYPINYTIKQILHKYSFKIYRIRITIYSPFSLN